MPRHFPNKEKGSFVNTAISCFSISLYLCPNMTLECKFHLLPHLIEPSGSQLLRLLLCSNEELQERQKGSNNTS